MNPLVPYTETINGQAFRMIAIPGGAFDMGAYLGNDEWEKQKSAPIQKNIRIDTFYMAEVPVTQVLWKAVMQTDWSPSEFIGDLRPVEQVSWKDAQQFIKALNDSQVGIQRTAQDGMSYRLPSETRWEYAARAGETQGTEYSGSKNIKEVAWFSKNSHSETKPVGLKLPNAFGLYDLTGNVWEWNEDTWIGNLENMPKNGDPRKEGDEGLRSSRGGAWYSSVFYTHLAYRNMNDTENKITDIGFRISRY